MIAPRSSHAARILLASSLFVLASCSTSPAQDLAVRVQALDGWVPVSSRSTQDRAAAAVDELADRTPGGRPSSEGEALSGSRPGIHIATGQGRWAEAVLRFGPDAKEAALPSDPAASPADPPATTALLVRRPHGTTAWQAVDLPGAEIRPTVAAVASAIRGDLVALHDIGPRAFDAARRAAQAAAAARQVPASVIELDTLEEVTWPNSALGLPQPGMVYTMALVPGHRITLRLPGHARCVVHTSDRNAIVAPEVAR